MSIEETSTEGSPEETAVRMATLLTTVMNMAAILHDEPALAVTERDDLRSTFLWLADEMAWLGGVVAGGSTAGIVWPSDAQGRIERLRADAGAWDSITSIPPHVSAAALACIEILQPNAAEPRSAHHP